MGLSHTQVCGRYVSTELTPNWSCRLGETHVHIRAGAGPCLLPTHRQRPTPRSPVCLQQSVCPQGPRPPAAHSHRDSMLPTTSGTKAGSAEVPRVSEKRPLSC